MDATERKTNDTVVTAGDRFIAIIPLIQEKSNGQNQKNAVPSV
jgi:hypothetical protein